MMAMFTRLLTLPSSSFFLLGPRGTGKTTWLGQVLPDARWYDLIRSREVVRLSRDPDLASRQNIKRCFGVYLGDHELKDGVIRVLPLARFLRRLHAGDVLGT